MGSKYRWFDFADSRRLQGDDARVERLGQQQGLTGESSPIPVKSAASSKSEGPTASSIRQANEKAVGGKDKRCSIGKKCNATCIHVNDNCLVGLSPPVGAALSRVSKVLSEQVESGMVSEETAEEVVAKVKELEQSQTKAFAAFKSLLDSGKVTDVEADSVARLLVSTIVTPGQDRNIVRKMSFDDIEETLKPGRLEALEEAYQKSFKNNKFDPSQPGGMGDLIKNTFLINQISDEVAEAAYYMLPSKVRSAIDKAGAVKGTAVMYGGDDSNGNPTFTDKPTRERGIFLVKRWMEQGGLDPYTGKPIDIRNAEPEHMVAFAHALAKGGGGDQPRNLLWAAPQPNNQKAGADDNFVTWKKNLEEYKSMGRDRYNREVYQPALKESESTKGKKGAAPSDLANALSSVSPEERVATTKKLIESYGDKVRYLVRAAGVGWQHQDRDLDHRQGGKPAFMNNGVPKLPGTNVKPSTAVLIALSAVDPAKRESLKSRLEDLRKARILSDSEVSSVRGDNEARLRLQGQKSKEYGESLANLLNEFVPNLGSYL
jgi:hypothetical protein